GLPVPGAPAGGPRASGRPSREPPGERGSGEPDPGESLHLVLGLSPPLLGPVQVVLRFREGGVHGEILVAGAAASRTVEQALPELKEALSRWLTVDGLKVRLLPEAAAGHPIPFPP